MPSDTKELIADAAVRLIRQRNHKRLTVKDVVDECRITRQTFYYHFEDMIDLLDWVVKRDMQTLLDQVMDREPEEALKMTYRYLIDRKPLFRNGMNNGYHEAIIRITTGNVREYLGNYLKRRGVRFRDVDQDLAIEYHALAIFGCLIRIEDDANADRRIHEMYLLMSGQADIVES